ncbi:MAG TPA: GAF domain-containing protein [Pseudonocardiaceae bacterium]|jgi:hypothetical protein
MTAVGTLLLALSVGLPIWEAGEKDKERKAALETANEATAAYDRHMHKILIPLGGLLAEIISAPTSKSLEVQQAQFKQAIIGSALDTLGNAELRASLFECDTEVAPTKLTCSTLWKGRDHAPRPEFSSDNDAGKEALRVLSSRETNFIDDAEKRRPPGWGDKTQHDYLTYIQSPVYNGDRSFGLLCLDAPNSGDLERRDIRMVELLASLLGCVLAIEPNTQRPGATPHPRS